MRLTFGASVWKIRPTQLVTKTVQTSLVVPQTPRDINHQNILFCKCLKKNDISHANSSMRLYVSTEVL